MKPTIPSFSFNTPLFEDEIQLMVSEQHLPTKPYYQYISFGELVSSPIELKEFDTQAELDAYLCGVNDAIENFAFQTYKISLSEDRETIRIRTEN